MHAVPLSAPLRSRLYLLHVLKYIYIYILFSLSQPTKAGTGSVLNAVGEVEMDAMMMDGDNLGSGK